jgi:mRNA interferase MazF
VVLAPSGRDDWLLCQVTSNPYSDPSAIRLTAAEMLQGSLQTVSFARPLKLFTASADLMVKRIAVLRPDAFDLIVDTLIQALKGNLPA